MREGLGTALRRLTDRLDGDVEQIYREAGLDFRPRYYPVVRALCALGPSSIKELSKHAGLTHSALSQTVQQMRRAGLVEAAPGADARERRVCLSERGEHLVSRLEDLWEAIARAADALDEELPCSLSVVLDEALAALHRRSFRERVRAAMASDPPPSLRRRP